MSQLGECVSAVSKTLRRFSVYFLYTEILEAYRDAMNVLLRVPMPELTDVTLHELPIPTALGQSYVLLSACRILNLSLYQFDWITKEDLHGLLQSAGQLVKLLLTVPMQARQDFTKRQEDTRLIMPNLREYTVNFSPYRAHANSTLAFSFTAPSLETLRIHVYGSIPTDEARATICRMFEGFIHASAPRRLTTLHLRQGAVQAATRVLPLLPSLTTLHLSIDVHLVAVSGEQHALWRTVLARLDEGPEEMVCPALETLFTGTWAFSSHLRLLQRVAQTRRQGGRQIRRLALAEWPSQTAETALSELPSSASQAYELEAALADEVGELMIGEWRFDKEKRTWEKRSGGGEDAEEETFPM
ncbi:hypothetical protein CALVIDRAFT_563436 [Calocera viscosa TUFC12733]|uniref:F-box domain-containing protein n=1 Tax=Calocera viscosa (strain TUFC12733) TaxID=1330018 RepID=A0A167MJR0_CALVF|nr:hypothetical protein CALVIDRAFT_563436 [Calocera viscosa TUFC12733]